MMMYLEIGPGMGVLTKYLLKTTHVCEIDTESVTYLDENYPKLKDKIISQDFLRYNINEIFLGGSSLSLGISIQYFDTNCFRTLEYLIRFRICRNVSKKKWHNVFVKRRTKSVWNLSVLVQAFMMQNICYGR
jgi:16S rRNA (adenine1518-N6/adenine1519-N6)-dimethyltransferase